MRSWLLLLASLCTIACNRAPASDAAPTVASAAATTTGVTFDDVMEACRRAGDDCTVIESRWRRQALEGPVTADRVPALCMEHGLGGCRSAFAESKLSARDAQAALDRIEALSRAQCGKDYEARACTMHAEIAYAGRRDTVLEGDSISYDDATRMTKCKDGDKAACREGALAAANAFADYVFADFLARGCAAGDEVACWDHFVYAEDSRGVLDTEANAIVDACKKGVKDACAVAPLLKTKRKDASPVPAAPPADARWLQGVQVVAQPRGEPLLLDERVLARETRWLGNAQAPETRFVRLRVGSMAGNLIRFASSEGSVLTWREHEGTRIVTELAVLAKLRTPLVEKIDPISPLVPKKQRADL